MELISIIIPSVKSDVLTLKSLRKCPVPYEVITVKKQGLGFARNYGAAQARHDMLVFLDDDLILKFPIWNHILGVALGEFRMTFLGYFPCTRVMSIHRRDFWSVGGFDCNIRFTGEDRDFYVRALDVGLKFKEIPLSLTVHQPHVYRYRNIHIAIGGIRENMQFLIKYWRKHPGVFRIDFLDRVRRWQARTLLLQLVFLLYYAVKFSVYTILNGGERWLFPHVHLWKTIVEWSKSPLNVAQTTDYKIQKCRLCSKHRLQTHVWDWHVDTNSWWYETELVVL